MDSVKIEGGKGNEAIEIGLAHVVSENKNARVTQVILIGDSPPNTEGDIFANRMYFHGETYWQSTKFKEKVDYKTEIRKLAEPLIPVNTFYLKPEAGESFNMMARVTNGKSNYLDLNQNKASETLIEIVTGQILKDIGGNNGVGDAYYNEYVKRHAANNSNN